MLHCDFVISIGTSDVDYMLLDTNNKTLIDTNWLHYYKMIFLSSDEIKNYKHTTFESTSVSVLKA